MVKEYKNEEWQVLKLAGEIPMVKPENLFIARDRRGRRPFRAYPQRYQPEESAADGILLGKRFTSSCTSHWPRHNSLGESKRHLRIRIYSQCNRFSRAPLRIFKWKCKLRLFLLSLHNAMSLRTQQTHLQLKISRAVILSKIAGQFIGWRSLWCLALGGDREFSVSFVRKYYKPYAFLHWKKIYVSHFVLLFNKGVIKIQLFVAVIRLFYEGMNEYREKNKHQKVSVLFLSNF